MPGLPGVMPLLLHVPSSLSDLAENRDFLEYRVSKNAIQKI